MFLFLFFFFQAEDGIRDADVTGVQTCALPIFGAAVTAPVERENAAVPGEVRDLHLPVPRVDDRPRRQEEDGRLARAVDLVVELHAVALDVPGLVRIAGPRLLVRGWALQLNGHCVLLSSQESIQSRSSRCPVSIPESRSRMIPSLNVYTSVTSASSDSSSPSCSRTGAKASLRTARHSACTRARSSWSSGRFQASACSSNQIFWYGRSSSR